MKRAMTPEDLPSLQLALDPQVHPDGRRVLFGRRTVTAKNKYLDHLFTVTLDGDLAQWTQGEQGARAGRWRPGGDDISFIGSRREGAPQQLWLLPGAGGEARALTALPEGTLERYAWSPDGRWVAFTFRAAAPEWTEAARKDREERGLSQPPRVLDHAWYRLDGDGVFGAQRFALHLLDARTGAHRTLYGACAVGAYKFAWSPDSRELAVAHTLHKDTWQGTVRDALVRVPVAGRPRRLAGLGAMRIGELAWSPDGRRIAFIGHAREKDVFDVGNMRLYAVDARGGPADCLTAEDDLCLNVMSLSDMKDAYSFSYLAWAPDGKSVYVSVGARGETHLGRVRLGGPRRVESLTRGRFALTAGPLDAAGRRMGCLLATAERPSEVAVLDLRVLKPRRLTRLNDAFFAAVETSRPEEFWVTAEDGWKSQAWVILPPKSARRTTRRGRIPAVLEIHGGPHAAYGWSFFHEFQCLAAQGYAVVYGNPRGSKGYGEAHATAIVGRWGDRDWADVRALAAWMKGRPGFDARRLGVMGGSYGGYMTNWAVGHCDDFRAAVTDRCVSNMVSMTGTSDYPFGVGSYWPGNPWGGLDAVAPLWEISPIASFDRVRTPMLVIHSEGDLRCNIEQAEQVFTALQVRGVESRFVRYPPTTSHGLSRGGPPDLRVHRLREILRWWRRHLG